MRDPVLFRSVSASISLGLTHFGCLWNKKRVYAKFSCTLPIFDQQVQKNDDEQMYSHEYQQSATNLLTRFP